MKRLLLALLFVFIGFHDPRPIAQEPPRHDKYAADPDAFCMAGPPLPEQAAHGHECHCRMVCSPGPDSRRLEDMNCELYCTSSRCLCHGDQTCDQPMEPPK